MTKQNKTDFTPASSPSSSYLPPLTKEIKEYYSILGDAEKQIFSKVYLWSCSHLLNKRYYLKYYAPLFYYWAVDLVRVKLKLSASELAVLSFIYQVSDKGARIIHSKCLRSPFLCPDLVSGSLVRVLASLSDRGYLLHYARNYQEPYLQRSISKGKPFILMSPAGIKIIKDIEAQLYDLVKYSSYEEITGLTIKNPD